MKLFVRLVAIVLATMAAVYPGMPVSAQALPQEAAQACVAAVADVAA
jgi:hypothetical protein